MSDPLRALEVATGQSVSSDSTGLPNIPAVPNTDDSGMRNWMASVKDWIEKAVGSNGFTGFVTKKYLADIGVVQSNSDGTLGPPVAPSMLVPPTPTGLHATGAMTNIILDWDDPNGKYGNHSHTEIWAAQTNSFSSAVLVGQAAGATFAHAVGAGSTRYYWIRFVSTSSVKGPFNSVSGTAASTSNDPAWLLSVLTSQLGTSQLTAALNTRIDLIDAASSVAGSVNSRLATLQSQINSLTSIPDYSGSTAYAAGAQVKYSGGLYQAKSATTGNLPTNTTYWLYLGDYSSLGDTVAAHTTQIGNLVAADSAEATARTTLATQMRGGYTGTDLTALSTGLLYDERQARSTADTALSSSITALSATVSNNNTTLTAALTTEQTARAAADSALATNVSTLQAKVVSRPNLLPNADFSSGLAGWTGYGVTFTTGNTAWGNAAQWSGSSYSGTATLVSDPVPAVAGVWYTVSGDSLCFRTAGLDYFDLLFFDAGGSQLLDGPQNPKTINHDFAVDDANRSVTAVETQAPANAVSMRVRWVAEGLSGATALGCRNIKLERGRLPYTPFTNEAVSVQTAAAIINEATARATADTAEATARTTLQASISGGSNLLTNAGFDIDLSGWSFGWEEVPADDDGAMTRDLAAPTWCPVGMHTIGLHRTGTPAGSRDMVSSLIPAEPGARYCASAWLAAHRCNTQIYLAAYDESLTLVGAAASDLVGYSTGTSGGTSLQGWNRSFVFYTIPTTARYVNLLIRQSAAVAADPYNWACHPMIERATASQTQPSPWASGAEGLRSSVQTQGTAIAGLSAQYTVKVDVNGYVAGYGLASTAVNGTPYSEFTIVADKFSIAPVATDSSAADGSPFFYLTSPTVIGGVTVPAGAYMKSAYIVDAGITNAKIANLAVDSAKIADAAIVTAKIGDAQISTVKIQDAAITNAKIGVLAVGYANIQNAAVGTIKIADAAITSAKIGDAEVTNAKIASAAITSAKIADAAITSTKIGDAEIGTLKLAGNTVTVPVGAQGTFTAVTSSADFGGGPVVIVASGVWTDEAGGMLTVTRDGSTILFQNTSPLGSTVTLIDTPSAGSHYYSVVITASSGICGITALGCKR